ncbi:MAG: serine/threonine protein kinase [Mycolicibacterium cosmeticum]|nr:serine/threonine protein kinase [Mycolicibacterium cosmeticum]
MTTTKSRVGTQFGKYEINALLGTGGMGEVYAAYDTEKGRTVALKILPDQYAGDERFRERFLRESRAAAILQEPHVIPIHDWGEVDGNLYIDMRLVNGQTLRDLIGNRPLDPERAVSIVQQVADALDAAHAERLIHRDIKPQNIIVTPSDFAYLVDFGIAESIGDTRLTVAGMQVGSFAYMAPERFNDQPCTTGADVYSLACVLYEALTGDAPYPAGSFEGLIAAHALAPPPSPSAVNPRVPAAFDDVIARGMAKDPDDRYGSAGALGRAAHRALHASSSGPDPYAHTMARPLPATAPDASVTYAGPAATGPTVVMNPSPGDTRGRRGIMPLAIAGLVGVILLGAIGVLSGMLASKNSTPQEAVSTVASPPAGVTVAGPTVYQTITSAAMRPPPSPSAAPPVRVNPQVTSYQQLRQIADNDRPLLLAEANNEWVPQLSSKRPGVFDEGYVWDNDSTLAEHVRLRDQYGAKLLWSGDWSTFDAANYWVTIAPFAFPSAGAALQWCTVHGFDPDHCYAKLVSTSHSVSGSTAHN